MVNIKKTIYYLVDFKTKEIFIYDNFMKARDKRESFMEKYGPRTFTLSNGNILEDCYPINMSQRVLKHYYGTIWMLYKFTEGGAFISHIEGRKKELDQIAKFNDVSEYTFKKIIITPYHEFKKQFEEPEDIDSDLQDLREMIE